MSVSRSRPNTRPPLHAQSLSALRLNHDAEHTLGLVLRQPERLHGVLDRETVGDQSVGELRSSSQKVGRLGEVPARYLLCAAKHSLLK